MKLAIRRLQTIVEDRYEEAGKKARKPLRKIAVVAIIQNPYVGQYVDDLSDLTAASVPLGEIMAKAAVEAAGDTEIQGYGKGGVVGLAGELEHANALLTTDFATPFRDRIPGSVAWISSMTKVAAPGVTIDIPMNAVTDVYVRSHYNGMSITLNDGPAPDEVALIFCMASGSRLNARVGGMTYLESVEAAARR